MPFRPVDPHQSFPSLEENIIKLWQKNDIFSRSVKEKNAKKTFTFYDGPPFATGLPHYGHILASTLKDVFPRYKTMQGHRVERVWGWDCHGLPIENIVEEDLNLGSREEIEGYGIGKFCESCRENVLRYASEWEKTIQRLGRFVDMKNSYRTMDNSYIESVWWVFRSLWDESLIYESLKSIHYCPRCDTPLSNFEVSQAYQEITDHSAYVKFSLANEPNTYLLAWTTTPWTLPGNVSLALNPDIPYLKIKHNSEYFILAKEIFEKWSQNTLSEYQKTQTPNQEGEIISKEDASFLAKFCHESEIIETLSANSLVNQKYNPLFSYYDHALPPEDAFPLDPQDNLEDLWRNYCTIQTAPFVTTTEGTGIVHIAPAFGEDDFLLAKEKSLPLLRHVLPNGKFTAAITDFPETEVKPKRDPSLTDRRINELLEAENKLFLTEKYRHNYPHCWRCDTPLLNYTAPSWYVRVESLRPELLKANEQINWVPGHIKQGRFGKWLSQARDWAISRNRFWGAPIPVWRCDHCGDTICISSQSELESLSGQKIDDLHKHILDDLTWPCPHCPQDQSVQITFVRHGHTQWNENHRFQSDSDIPLDQDGISHAKSLQKEINPQDYDIVISSPLRRARETAELIAPEHKIIISDLLRESSCGEFEGLTVQEALTKHPDLKNKSDLRWAFKYGMETPAQTKVRLTEFLQELEHKYPNKKVLVVTHGNLLHVLEWMQTQDEKTFEKHFPNLHHLTRTIHPTYYRVPEVLDCWFESGSMPYAQTATKEKTTLPADFIAEGLDQTRGWFYTLTVLSAALTSRKKIDQANQTLPAFKNCIVNGIVLAEDGKKMSKRLKNYPAPDKIFHNYGADAMRFYLLNSPVVKAEDFRFSEKGVLETVRNILLPLWNTYSFFVTYANTDSWSPESQEKNFKPDHPLDRWILSKLHNFISNITQELDSYQLFEATNHFPLFLDELTNWYIRRSRRRFWKTENDNDKLQAYTTLYLTLTTLAKLFAPFCPFISEEIYQNLTSEDSVHLTSWPKSNPDYLNPTLEKEIDSARLIVELGHSARSQAKIKVRQPLSTLRLALPEKVSSQDLKPQLETIKEELNIKEIKILSNPSEIAQPILKPNARLLGPRLGKKVQKIIQSAQSGSFTLNSDNTATVESETLQPNEFELHYQGKDNENCAADKGFVVALDTTFTPALKLEGQARDLVRLIQDLRRQAQLEVSDRITLSLQNAEEILTEHSSYIQSETLTTKITSKPLPSPLASKNLETKEKTIICQIQKSS